uniref:Uncharacterized protein n=1 Tax=Ditylenchus dipsaci TaxID=166011 RepID=A0A915DBN9_9BILA
MVRYSVCTADCRLPLTLWITFVLLNAFKKFLMKVLCVICSGQTLMIVVVGDLSSRRWIYFRTRYFGDLQPF